MHVDRPRQAQGVQSGDVSPVDAAFVQRLALERVEVASVDQPDALLRERPEPHRLAHPLRSAAHHHSQRHSAQELRWARLRRVEIPVGIDPDERRFDPRRPQPREHRHSSAAVARQRDGPPPGCDRGSGEFRNREMDPCHFVRRSVCNRPRIVQLGPRGRGSGQRRFRALEVIRCQHPTVGHGLIVAWNRPADNRRLPCRGGLRRGMVSVANRDSPQLQPERGPA